MTDSFRQDHAAQTAHPAVIDAHVHVFLSAAEDPERTVDPLAPAERRAPVESLEAEMDAAGVHGAVLVPLGPEDSYVAGVLAAQPGRFAGIAVAAPAAVDGTTDARAGASADGRLAPGAAVDPAHVLGRLEAGGFAGLRLFGLPGHPADAPPWLDVCDALASAGKVLWLYPRPEDLDAVDALAGRLPDLRIVLNHCGFTQAGIGIDRHGRPRVDSPVPQPHEDQVLALARHPGVAVLLSGAYGFSHHPYPHPDVGSVVGRLADAFGVDRLAWASDFPWIVERPGYRACLALVDHHLPGLSPAERAAVLGGTIRRILEWKVD